MINAEPVYKLYKDDRKTQHYCEECQVLRKRDIKTIFESRRQVARTYTKFF